MKWPRRFEIPLPDEINQDAIRGILHTILLMLILIILPVGLFHLATDRIETALEIAATIPPLLACFWLLRRGYAQLASFILWVDMLAFATTLLAHGDGLQDIAILLYPAIILGASLLLQRRGYFATVTLTILSLIGIGLGQLNGLINNIGKIPELLLSDLFMAIVILMTTSFVLLLLAENTRKSMQQAEKNQAALSETNQKLALEIAERQRSQQIENAMYRISEAAHTSPSLAELYISIHNVIRELMHTKNFFISLYNKADDLITTPYLADEHRKSWPPYKPGKGLAAYVIRTGKPLLITPREFSELERSGQVEIILKRMVDWLGVPLKTSHGTIGVMVVQTYTEEERLSEADKDVLMFVSTQVATAIERKQAQVERQLLIAELEAKNAELERFTYTVSHDLKSPLITIRGFADFLQRDFQAGNLERVTQDIDRIIHSAEKMHELLNGLLELSRIGRLINPPEAIAFDTIIREALGLLEGPITARSAQVDVAPNLPIIYGDRARLVEVMQNLVENALKFTSEQPEPHIEIGVQENATKGIPVFFIRDNGIGIEPKYHQKIFGLFEKLDASGEGTGIGLALVKRIIEVHGGSIWVSSNGKGCGTTFYFTLPEAQSEP